MKITRHGSRRDGGTTPLLECEAKPPVIVDSGLQFRFEFVIDRNTKGCPTGIRYDYTVELSRKDLDQTMRELLASALNPRTESPHEI